MRDQHGIGPFLIKLALLHVGHLDTWQPITTGELDVAERLHFHGQST